MIHSDAVTYSDGIDLKGYAAGIPDPLLWTELGNFPQGAYGPGTISL